MVHRIHGVALAAAAVAACLAAAGCGDQRAYPILRPSMGDVVCPIDVVGFATLDGGTNGGNDSAQAPVTVTSAAAFIAQAATSADPNVIFVDGMITLPDTVEIASNKTIIGVGAKSGFTGGGLHLVDVTNVILRNLVIAKVAVGEGDAINLKRSTNVWIDHCDLSTDPTDTAAGYDGLVEITHASDYVTVSWTRFHDHRDTGLIGNLEDNAAEDTGKLRATYHHNLFLKVYSGPRVRFGTVHVFSNHFQEVSINGVAAETFSSVVVDHNMFDRVMTPITTNYEDVADGSARETSNRFVGSGPLVISATNSFVPTYSFSTDAAESVPAIVAACAGTGKITP